MKEIKVKMIDDTTFMQVHEKKDATHVALELRLITILCDL